MKVIYTLGAPESRLEANGFDRAIELNRMFLGRVFGPSESLVSCDTWQFDDHAAVDQTRFDVAAKAARLAHQFPVDLQAAFDLGARLAGRCGAARAPVRGPASG